MWSYGIEMYAKTDLKAQATLVPVSLGRAGNMQWFVVLMTQFFLIFQRHGRRYPTRSRRSMFVPTGMRDEAC